MPKDFGGDAPDDRVAVAQAIECGADRCGILSEAAKRLIFAVEEMGVARLQSFDKCVVIAFARLIDRNRADSRGSKPHDVELPGRKRLLANNEDRACNEG